MTKDGEFVNVNVISHFVLSHWRGNSEGLGAYKRSSSGGTAPRMMHSELTARQ